MSTVVTALLLLTACGEPPQQPEVRLAATFAKGGNAACPTAADVIVSNEGQLNAALAAAIPGTVIGVDGYPNVGWARITSRIRIANSWSTIGGRSDRSSLERTEDRDTLKTRQARRSEAAGTPSLTPRTSWGQKGGPSQPPSGCRGPGRARRSSASAA